MDERYVRGFAEAVTGAKGSQALERFSKQLVLGASRCAGDEVLSEVFQKELLQVNGVEVLTKMTFEVAGRFRWSFSETWLNDPDSWHEKRCVGLALVGMQEDARFFFLRQEDAFQAVDDADDGSFVLTIPVNHHLLAQWEAQFCELKKSRG